MITFPRCVAWLRSGTRSSFTLKRPSRRFLTWDEQRVYAVGVECWWIGTSWEMSKVIYFLRDFVRSFPRCSLEYVKLWRILSSFFIFFWKFIFISSRSLFFILEQHLPLLLMVNATRLEFWKCFCKYFHKLGARERERVRLAQRGEGKRFRVLRGICVEVVGSLGWNMVFWKFDFFFLLPFAYLSMMRMKIVCTILFDDGREEEGERVSEIFKVEWHERRRSAKMNAIVSWEKQGNLVEWNNWNCKFCLVFLLMLFCNLKYEIWYMRNVISFRNTSKSVDFVLEFLVELWRTNANNHFWTCTTSASSTCESELFAHVLLIE